MPIPNFGEPERSEAIIYRDSLLPINFEIQKSEELFTHISIYFKRFYSLFSKFSLHLGGLQPMPLRAGLSRDTHPNSQ